MTGACQRPEATSATGGCVRDRRASATGVRQQPKSTSQIHSHLVSCDRPRPHRAVRIVWSVPCGLCRTVRSVPCSLCRVACAVRSVPIAVRGVR